MSNKLQQGLDWRNDAELSEKWKYRFDFYDKYGVPALLKQPDEFKKACSGLKYGDRLKVIMNFWALIFPIAIFYLFVLGLWRQSILVILITIGVTIVEYVIFGSNPEAANISFGITVGLGIMFGMRANIWYYYKKTKGDAGWMF
jgi:hypothetical protein